MGIFQINHNISSLNVQRNLNTTSLGLQKSLEKLSSGLRINTGWDGPADLVISELMRADIGATSTAIRNNQEIMGLMGTADGVLGSVSKLLVDLKAKVIHASNTDMVTTAQTDADQAEYNAAVDAITTMLAGAKYNGADIFSGTKDFQVGPNSGDTSSFDLTSPTLGVANGDDVTDTGTLALVEGAISVVATLRGNIGSFMKGTLQANIDNLSTTMENVSASESYIRDTNMAEETSNYTKQQILVQAGMSVLAQANVGPQSVLQLLK